MNLFKRMIEKLFPPVSKPKAQGNESETDIIKEAEEAEIMETYLIAGLGNPDKKYDHTRHNAGFDALDALAHKLGVSVTEKKFKGLFGQTTYHGNKVMLLKPLTYMNNSGEAVQEASAYFKIPADHIIILFDDINFPCGKMRLRPSGSAGGHNGIKSIIAMTASDAFPRVRIGVGGLKENEDMISHVLGRYEGADKQIMEKVFPVAADAALAIMDVGVTEAMNRFNGKTVE